MGGLTPLPVKSALNNFPEDFSGSTKDSIKEGNR
jgi:hypothetical protein